MDKNYWIEYYKKDLAPHEPSQFSMDILEHLEVGRELLELGCGNGRDSVFFGKNGLCVTAIDQAELEIGRLREQHPDIRFLADDFVLTKELAACRYDYIYSRFTLHAITVEQEREMLSRVYGALKPGGRFFIEVRSTMDEIFGLGEEVGRNAFVYEGHYRRFIVKEELDKYLTGLGFRIIMSIEGRGFAVLGDQDPIVLRVIAEK